MNNVSENRSLRGSQYARLLDEQVFKSSWSYILAASLVVAGFALIALFSVCGRGKSKNQSGVVVKLKFGDKPGKKGKKAKKAGKKAKNGKKLNLDKTQEAGVYYERKKDPAAEKQIRTFEMNSFDEEEFELAQQEANAYFSSISPNSAPSTSSGPGRTLQRSGTLTSERSGPVEFDQELASDPGLEDTDLGELGPSKGVPADLQEALERFTQLSRYSMSSRTDDFDEIEGQGFAIRVTRSMDNKKKPSKPKPARKQDNSARPSDSYTN